jgi:hypothetical protein
MPHAPNVVPFLREPAQAEEDHQYTPANVLGILHRKDFELWICRSATGALTLKWWRWRQDLEQFFPLEEGELTLNQGDLQPLADVLSSVDGLLTKKKLL